jgi:hypothetical protein
MAIKVTSSNLTRLISSAEKARDRRLRGVKDMIARYQGPERAGDTSGNDAPENHEFSFSSLMQSRRAYDVPTVRTATALTSSETDARILQVGLNRWIRDTRYRSVMRETSTDYDFAWPVLLTTERPATELAEDKERGIAWRPYVKRVPFKTAFWDPLASTREEVRFAGHMEVADREDLIREAEENPDSGWDAKALRDIAADSGVSKLKRETIEDAPSRDELAFYQVWVRDAEITDEEFEAEGIADDSRHLYHGKLYYLPVDGSGVDPAKGDEGNFDIFLRKPQLYYGPQWGPYEFNGAFVVPDDPFPLSPLMPNKASVDALNRLVAQANASDENYGRFIASGDDTVGDQIRNARHDFVIVIDGLGQEGKTATTLEKGGSTTQQQSAIALRREQVGRNTGMTEMQQAAVGQSNSASEAVIANSSAEARVAVIDREFIEIHNRALTTVAWYLWHDEDVVFPLSRSDADELGIDAIGEDGKPATFRGGLDHTGKPIGRDSFYQLEVVIEITSVQRASEQKLKAQFTGMMEYLTWAAATLPTAPWLKADKITDAAADMLDLPKLRSVVNMEALREWSEAQAMALFQQPPQGEQPAPKLAGDVGGKVLQMPGANTGGPPREGGPNKPAQGKQPGRSVGTQAGKAAKMGAA